jgi:hypothetical protein
MTAELCSKVFGSILETEEDWRKTLGNGPQHRTRLGASFFFFVKMDWRKTLGKRPPRCSLYFRALLN